MAALYHDQDASPGGSFGSFGEMKLSINGIGVQYPPYLLEPTALETLVARHYPDSPALRKVLAINQYTGIETRSAIGTVDHPLANEPAAPSIATLSQAFIQHAVPLAITACRTALYEARLVPADITHIVSTTCTHSANPGFDHFVARGLGITHPVEKVLLHGVGCSGGLAGLRTAANLALGSTFRARKARILVVAAEISSLLVRSELDSIRDTQETRIGVTLFSDCASAVVLSNGVGVCAGEAEGDEGGLSVYDLLGWEHDVIPDSEGDLGFDVDPLGWKVLLSPRVPQLATTVVAPTFARLLFSLHTRQQQLPPDAPSFDWATHPGGATILSGLERALGISGAHQRASYDTYVRHGNSSSATIFSVLDRLRAKDMDALAADGAGKVKEHVVATAFGPGICVEMAMLRRNLKRRARGGRNGESERSGLATPPETDSEGSRSDGEAEAEAEEGNSLSEALNGVELD